MGVNPVVFGRTNEELSIPHMCGGEPESLVAGLGEDLVHDIFGTEYFDYGDGGGVYTASINGTSYAQHILGQISSANLPTDTKVLEVQLLNGSFDYIAIDGLNIYQILTALYIKSAIWVLKP